MIGDNRLHTTKTKEENTEEMGLIREDTKQLQVITAHVFCEATEK